MRSSPASPATSRRWRSSSRGAALAWLLDGTLMLMVAGVMLAYDWVLALVAFVVSAPLGFVLQQGAEPPREGVRRGPGSTTPTC